MPIYMERSILAIERILINGGKRGYLLGMPPEEVARVVNPTLVDAALVA
jgi:prolyl-tRNA editing enzyme YbaK/EbsC (Cys-tRNA(Pro) deacylase)